MAVSYFVKAKIRESAPIYVRVYYGHQYDIYTDTRLMVDPRRWSNKTQTLKQRIQSDDDKEFISKLDKLRGYIKNVNDSYPGARTKDWLTGVVNEFHNIKNDDSKTLNGFIESFLTEAEAGEVKNFNAINFNPGTLRAFRGFQRIFNEYQGKYTTDRIEQLRTENKPQRPIKILDFEDITIDFHKNFVAFLSNEGYKVNTIGRFVKELKYFMRMALAQKKHTNKEFMEGSFKGYSEDSHAIYLTQDEIEKIYKYDLKTYPRMELARDAFIVLCETALRISDYKQIDVNIKERNGKKYIHIYQTKTSEPVVIPLTPRMDAILKKYDGKLPRIPEQHVNRNIKIIAMWCGLDEVITWEAQKFGKKYTATAKKYQLITNHTGRRSACTNMYKAGIKSIDVMRISGHKSEKSFLTYIRITPEEAAERLSDDPYFSGKLRAV